MSTTHLTTATRRLAASAGLAAVLAAGAATVSVPAVFATAHSVIQGHTGVSSARILADAAPEDKARG